MDDRGAQKNVICIFEIYLKNKTDTIKKNKGTNEKIIKKKQKNMILKWN